jgi:hypothetical protein
VVLLRKSLPQNRNLQTSAELGVRVPIIMKIIYILIILICSCSTTTELPSDITKSSFSTRVKIAKNLLNDKSAEEYFINQLLKSLGKELQLILVKCTSMDKENLEGINVVADVSPIGEFINIEYREKTNRSECFVDSLSALHAPPPPVSGNKNFPIVFDIKVTQ